MGATFQSPKDPKADPCVAVVVVVLGGKEWRPLLITTTSSSVKQFAVIA